MVRNHDEDLFEGTKMTFGEHIEELRVCLIRSLLGVAVGLLVGMLAGREAVRWVKEPVEAAMDTYYQKRDTESIVKQYRDVAKQTTDILRERKLVHQDAWLEVAELDRLAALRDRLRPAAPAADSLGSTPSSPSSTAAEVDPVAATSVASPESPVIGGAMSEPGPPTLEMFKTRIWTRPETQTRSLSMYEPFMIWLKASLIVGVGLASPWVFYQIWLFVAAGLYPHERKYIYVYLPISLILFVAGILLAYYGVFPPVLNFLLDFNDTLGIDPEPRINDWISFALLLPLGFGFSFQLPLVMLFLERLGIIPIKTYTQNWRVSILVICFISMILTPAEPISMMMMAAPLCLLYVFGLGLCKWMPRHGSPFGPGHEPA